MSKITAKEYLQIKEHGGYRIPVSCEILHEPLEEYAELKRNEWNTKYPPPNDGKEVSFFYENLVIQGFKHEEGIYASMDTLDSIEDGIIDKKFICDYAYEGLTHWKPLPEAPNSVTVKKKNHEK